MVLDPIKRKNRENAEAQLKADISCQFICGDGTGKKIKEHYPICLKFKGKYDFIVKIGSLETKTPPRNDLSG